MEQKEIVMELKELIQIGAAPIEKICHTLEILLTIGTITLDEYAELYQEAVIKNI